MAHRRARARPLPPSRYQEWTPDRALGEAAVFGVRLGAEHWRVVACAREQWAKTRRPLDLGALAKCLELPPARLVALFGEPVHVILPAIAGLE